MLSWLLRPPAFACAIIVICVAIVAGAQVAPTPSAPSQAPSAQNPAAQTPAAQATATPAQPAVSNPADALKVTSTGKNSFRVDVVQPSNLNNVFRAICTEQKLDCKGAETLTGYNVPKMTVDGSLREVVDNLLTGTGVNYEYTRETASSKAKLVLLGHAPQGNNAPLPARGNLSDVHPMPLHSVRFPGRQPENPNSGATEPTQNSTEPQSTPPQQPNNGPSASTPSGSSSDEQSHNLAALQQMYGGTTNATVGTENVLPFPDQFGNPVPATQTPAQYLPFPDKSGNPIPVKPGQTSGSPFPPAGIGK